MSSPFFSRRIRFFGNVAIMILCAVFFLVPFAFRGARMSIRGMRNDVADWLPQDFEETQELSWFRRHFLGSQFVVVSWDGCNADDPRYQQLVESIRRESLQTEYEGEDLEAHRVGDKYGLHTTGVYHENWGSHREKWLMGHDDEWYFVTRQGELYKWDGRGNLLGWTARWLQKVFHGKNRATGEYLVTFGEPNNNKYYEDPTRLAGRFFEGVMTGPELHKQLEESLIRGRSEDNKAAALEASIIAHQRLTGLVFGPTPQPGFDWQPQSFLDQLPTTTRSDLPDSWQNLYEAYITDLIEKRYDGDRDALLNASENEQLEHWYRLFNRLEVEPPPRQTCLIVTLNANVVEDLSRVVGRPVLGKPRGRILELATGECGIPADGLHLGGPPVDNVAIDEEGTITLLRLVTFSVIVGLTLSFLSFRSIRVTFMVFFVGGVSAVASMGIVWYMGEFPDAVLMSMPSLVYVLGLSGAVHIVNYYREACHQNGPRGASETAVKLGWFPCTLAAFTTSLGLISLYASNLTPIKKFGLFSAIGTMATVILLFTYLPSALQIWPPGYRKRGNREAKSGGLHQWIARFWDRVGEWVIRHHAVVTVTTIILLAIVGFGLTKVETSVQLLKLFDKDAKVIHDYRWLETNLGRLVPMEVVIRVDKQAQFDTSAYEDENRDPQDEYLQLSLLERVELSGRVRRSIESVFGEDGAQIIGRGMSTDVFVLPDDMEQLQLPNVRTRQIFSSQLEEYVEPLKETGSLRIDPETGEELWRVSLRLGAFNDVDYGLFNAELKRVVEPILTAYRVRHRVFSELLAAREGNLRKCKVLVLGWAPASEDRELVNFPDNGGEQLTGDAALAAMEINQQELFARTLHDLFQNRGFQRAPPHNKQVHYIDPAEPSNAERLAEPGTLSRLLQNGYDCVVLVGDHPVLDREIINRDAPRLVDATHHTYRPPRENEPSIDLTAAQIKASKTHPDQMHSQVTTTYTGIVPIVYKAQRTLMRSLMNSICLAFVMIAIVMMLLLRDWKRRVSWGNSLNISGGMASMLPNVFPVVLIFGMMGHLGIVVDIGSMMTASVAMGIAVDDTIHYLNWYRRGLRQGMSRHDAIRLAYRRVATAMTQTTLIAGFGLSVFALSTFTPTQRFGVLMLTLLIAALAGDLIFLPAILAGPIGKLFGLKDEKKGKQESESESSAVEVKRHDEQHTPATPAIHSEAESPPKAHPPPSGRSSPDLGQDGVA